MFIRRQALFALPALLAALAVACAGASPAPSPTPTLTSTSASAPALVLTPTLSLAPASTPTPPATSTLEKTLSPTTTPAAPGGSSASPTPPDPADSAGLQNTTLQYITELSQGLGPRQSATDQEEAAARYLAEEFTSFGYNVALQPFTVESLNRESSKLRIDAPGLEGVQVAPLSGTSFGRVSGALVPVGLGREEDIPAEGLAGKIALAERGVIRFSEKARRARDAGAIAIAVYNNQPGIFQGTLGGRSEMIGVGISQEAGRRIEQLASGGEIEAAISLEIAQLPSRNVVAEKPGTGDGVVILGGHYDTVAGVPGANDNASGTSVILTLAGELSRQSFPFALRFIAFGAEELGLRGSQFYVDSLSEEETAEIIVMMNFDALGSGSRLGTLGSPELVDVVVSSAARRGIDAQPSGGLTGGSSDHATFAAAGVPVVMFFSNDFSKIHTPEDTLDNINPRLPGDAARLALDLLEFLARPEGTAPPGTF